MLTKIKKTIAFAMVCIFVSGGVRWIRRRAEPDEREHRRPQVEKRKATTPRNPFPSAKQAGSEAAEK